MRNMISDQELKDLCYEAKIQGTDHWIVSDSITNMFDNMTAQDTKFRMEKRLAREGYHYPEH
jgi:hypothetical protein